MNDAQVNYTTTEKELLAIVFALDKFRSYLMDSHVVVFTDHAALKYLLSKKDAKSRLIQWVLLFQEFDFDLLLRPGESHVLVDHLSRIDSGEPAIGISDDLPDSFLFKVDAVSD